MRSLLRAMLRRAPLAGSTGARPSRTKARRQPACRPFLEALEDRLAPATLTWTGRGFSAGWFDGGNWNSGSFPIPVDGDTVVFPPGASRLVNTQNIIGLSLERIVFTGDGYDISGQLTDVVNEIRNDAGTNTYRAAINHPSGSGALALTVREGELRLSGAVQGVGGLVKTGEGIATLAGTTDNTYSGVTVVNEGILALHKTVGRNAVPGPLIIGGVGPGASVDVGASHQIADAAPVTINRRGFLRVGLEANDDIAENIGSLTMTGGSVLTSGSSVLGLGGNVSAGPAGADPALIRGRLSLGSATRTFTISAGPLDQPSQLIIDAAIIGNGGLIKAGAGLLLFAGNLANTYGGRTTVSTGTLELAKSGVLAIPGELVIGDGLGGVNADRVVVTLSGTQIADNVPVRINRSGRLELNGFDDFRETIGPLTMAGGSVTSTALLSELIVNGDVTIEAAPSAARIDARLQFPIPTTFTVADAVAGSDLITTKSVRGDVLKAGPGTWEVGGAPTDDIDSAIIVAGTLLVGESRAIGPVFMAGGRLAGNGIVRNLSAMAGTVSPGDGIGTLRLQGNSLPGNLGLLPGARFQPQLIPGPGDPHDRLEVLSGSVNLGGAVLDVVPTFLTAILSQPHHFVIVDNLGADPVVGTFANLPEGALVPAVAVALVNGQPQQQTQLYTISYRANTGNDVGLTYLTTATTAQNLQLAPAAINEGDNVTLTGNLTDPDADDALTLTITWGDGTTETHHPGTRSFQLTHRYTDNPPGQPHGAYTVHVAWFDQHGKGNSRDLAVTVHNVAPTVHLPATLGAFGLGAFGGLLVAPGFFTDPGRDRWTATVDYGDGSGSRPLGLHGHVMLLLHRYERPGTYRLTVTVTDDDGESGTASILVRVKSASPHADLDSLFALLWTDRS